MRCILLVTLVTLVAAAASCGPETTSFRTTEKGDGSDRSPPAAVYDVRVGGQLAHARVWSNGGYIGTSDEPMTHVGFEIENASRRAIVFDSDALGLAVFDGTGAALPAPAFTTLTPLGPSQVAIAPGATVTLDGYWKLAVRPRVVDHMRVQWSLRAGDSRHVETTSFTRDDDNPVIEYHPAESGTPRS